MVAIAAVLEPSARPGGLLSVTHPLPTGWQRGVEVVVGSLTAPDRAAPCPVGESPTTQHRGETAQFVPVILRQGIHCSLLGRPDTEAMARQALEVTGAYALSQELYDGAATNNPSLADALDLGTLSCNEDGDDCGCDVLCQAISLLEATAEDALSGRLAVIHVPLNLASCLGSAVVREGSGAGARLRTLAGNLVAVHGTGDRLYATGELWAGLGTAETSVYNDHRINMAEGWADAAGLVVFDPAFNVSITVACAAMHTS